MLTKYGLRYETKNAKISDCNENLATGISYKHEIKGSYYKYKHNFFHIFILFANYIKLVKFYKIHLKMIYCVVICIRVYTKNTRLKIMTHIVDKS